jgi:crotonobetainyl-CoA:carnitine CoA-transferase CaiB-like acyl-CoA transferase
MDPSVRRVRQFVQHLGASPASGHPPVSGPMTGIRVLDMSAVISGPWATSILADQGADVIKIESPTGPDLTRFLGPTPVTGMGSMYMTANRGKRSVTLDLQKAEGVTLLKQLAAKVDVVVQNYRPGVAERLGVHYDVLAQTNPQLVMLSISGFGPDGPYVEAKVYDQVGEALS